jgi:malate dehydrogenase (oxaloacetate-decarboxylating)
VVLAALRSALAVAGVPIDEARVLFLGAGAANVGTARAIAAARGEGKAPAEVQRRNLVFLDSRGLMHMGRRHVDDYKQPWALSEAEMKGWPDIPAPTAMAEAIEHYKPHVLIGASGMAGAFTEKFVRAMGRVADRPIIFALSNPTSHCEARPVDLHRWTEGRAIFATGSPFDPVETPDGPIQVAQANNMLVFPGVGLGAYVAGASRITDEMFAAAATAVSDSVSDDDRARGKILPSVADIREVSHDVALGVAREAMAARLAHKISEQSLEDHIRTEMWKPEYMRLVPAEL